MIGYGQPGHAFDEVTIQSAAPAVSGVYALYSAARFVYVGESQDIRMRLLQHLRGDNPEISAHAPTGFVFEPVAGNAARVARQDALIQSLAPAVNKRLG